MRKKGFTLIELLAVIVILAIIAVIAAPIITGIIEDAKKASFERSAEGVVEATKFDITNRFAKDGYTYEFENGNIDLGANVKVSNAKNLSGIIKYNSDWEVSYAIHNDKWCVVKTDKGVTINDYTDECTLETTTKVSAFTYENMAVIKSFEVGDNCVNYLSSIGFSSSVATTLCNGGSDNNMTLDDFVNSVFLGDTVFTTFENLKANNVIKNVIMSEEIKITGYDTKIGGFDVVIPSTINGKKVVAIGESAFHFIQLTSVIIPDSVICIEQSAFENNYLTNVIIPNSVLSIKYYAFGGNNLTKIVNKTSKSFNWGYIVIGTYGYEFITGTIETDNGDIEVTSE